MIELIMQLFEYELHSLYRFDLDGYTPLQLSSIRYPVENLVDPLVVHLAIPFARHQATQTKKLINQHNWCCRFSSHFKVSKN